MEGLGAVELFVAGPSGLAEGVTQGGVAGKRKDGAGERARRAGWDEEAGLAVEDNFGDAPPVGGDDGEGKHHGLDVYEAEGFGVEPGWVDKNVGPAIEGPLILAGFNTVKSDLFRETRFAQGGIEAPGDFWGFDASDHIEAERAVLLCKDTAGFYEIKNAFLLVESAYEEKVDFRVVVRRRAVESGGVVGEAVGDDDGEAGAKEGSVVWVERAGADGEVRAAVCRAKKPALPKSQARPEEGDAAGVEVEDGFCEEPACGAEDRGVAVKRDAVWPGGGVVEDFCPGAEAGDDDAEDDGKELADFAEVNASDIIHVGAEAHADVVQSESAARAFEHELDHERLAAEGRGGLTDNQDGNGFFLC